MKIDELFPSFLPTAMDENEKRRPVKPPLPSKSIAKLAAVIHVLHAIALALKDAAIGTDMRNPAAGLAVVFRNRRATAIARRQMIGRDAPIEIENA